MADPGRRAGHGAGGHRDRPCGAVGLHPVRRAAAASSSRRPPHSWRSDGWSGGGAPELVADLALEGGGVKGIGIVGAVSALAEAGYRFQRVAGTSAGAIAAALVAAISKKGDPMTRPAGATWTTSPSPSSCRKGKVHAFLDHHFGQAGELLSDADGPHPPDGRLLGRRTSSPGCGPIMNTTLGVTTFEDLKITPEEDPA